MPVIPGIGRLRGESQVPGQPGLHRKTVSQKKNKTKTNQPKNNMSLGYSSLVERALASLRLWDLIPSSTNTKQNKS
jgi:hypothetical protein